MALQADLNPRLIDLAQDLGGGAMMMLPSSRTKIQAQLGELEQYVASPQGHKSPERVALPKLAWDLRSSKFAGRHQQYETLYGEISLHVSHLALTR